MSDGLQASIAKMEREGVPGPAIATFGHYYEQLAAGESGMLPEAGLEPVTDVPDFDSLPAGDAPLDEAVVIKLNGGLGTSMGMQRAKSLLPVKDDLAFLDVIVRQVLALREESGARLPLVLMNSFYTRDDSLALLERYPELAADVPFDFVQHKEPKLLVDGLTPAEWPANPSLEWCPPGHGDIYPALLTSGMLATLLERGYRYAFMSNSDNLGAVLEPRILAWFAGEGLPYVAELTDRTPADLQGRPPRAVEGGRAADPARDRADAGRGHGRVHRPRPPPVLPHQQPVARPARAVRPAGGARRGDGAADDRQREDGRPGGQVDARRLPARDAMGAAVGVFEGAGRCACRARASCRSRRPPTCSSCAPTPTSWATAPASCSPPGRSSPPLVDLDDDHFKLLRDFDARFPAGAAVAARGGAAGGAGRRDVRRGTSTVRGSVTVEGPAEIEDGAGAGGAERRVRALRGGARGPPAASARRRSSAASA